MCLAAIVAATLVAAAPLRVSRVLEPDAQKLRDHNRSAEASELLKIISGGSIRATASKDMPWRLAGGVARRVCVGAPPPLCGRAAGLPEGAAGARDGQATGEVYLLLKSACWGCPSMLRVEQAFSRGK